MKLVHKNYTVFNRLIEADFNDKNTMKCICNWFRAYAVILHFKFVQVAVIVPNIFHKLLLIVKLSFSCFYSWTSDVPDLLLTKSNK